MKITKETKLSEVMQNRKAVELLIGKGISCLGCPMAMQETIEDGCLSHGMTKKEIEELIKRMNEK